MAGHPRHYDREQLASAVANARTMADVLRALGVVPRGANYEVAWAWIREWGIDARHLRRHVHQPWTFSDDEVRAAIATSLSMAGALTVLNREPTGHGYRFLRARIRELDIDTSHFVGQAWRRGNRTAPMPALHISTYLVQGSRYNSNHLRH